MWQIESHTNLASSCIDVGMARLHGISLTVAHRSPMFSVGSDSGQLHSNWWLRHDTGSPRLAAEHLLCTVPWSETPCLTTSAHSRTMFLLNRAWKPGCSLGTSVHSALETFVTMRYINLHLPYHTIPQWLKIDLYCLQDIVFHFWPQLAHPAARSVCDSWATC